MSESARPSVLVVDDAVTNVEVLAAALGDTYEVLAALSGAEALDVAAAQRPSLILLDVVMPGQDGYEVCRALKANPATRDIPVVFVTSLDDEADEERGLRLGAVDYLTKPVRPAIVRARVHNHLERDRLIRDLQQALAEVKTLAGLIPMCAWCKKVRDDQGYWMQVERYLAMHSDLAVTHGICPECLAKL
jgi:PleD family two-component response regulator